MSEVKHTLGPFEEALVNNRKLLITMSSIAQENLRNAVRGLLDRDEDLCNDAIAEDEEVNALERTIDHGCSEILMRYNPVATDLRSVLAAMKISTNLERISDQAENIARRSRKILKRGTLTEANLIEPIYEMARSLLEDAIRSYTDEDLELALGLYDRDKQLDKLHKKAIKRITKAMEEDTANLKSYLNLILIVRCLERVGDHAVNIGEDAVYIQQGADIRHVGRAALEEEE